jgi:AGCS family alanine or glycine:cation symporter
MDVAKLLSQAADRFGMVLVPVILVAALFFSVRLRFVQVLRFREAIRETIKSRQSGASGALSPFQAFMTAIAATVGTGNVVGVATAIFSGGPGALFWIWVYGFLAMSTKFAEASLGMHFRVARGEEVLSGPMYYLRDGLNSSFGRFLAGLFAVLGGCGVLFTTPMTQPNSVANSIAGQLETHGIGTGTTQIGKWPIENALILKFAIGVVLAILTWLVIVHGIKSIGRAAEKLSPIKVGFYMIGALVVVFTHITKLPEVLAMVFHDAFSTHAASGGATGITMMTAINFGIRRGVYANEAGYGTAAVAYGTAKSQRPDQQGLAAMMDVFIITFITCTLSALAVLLTGVWSTSKDGAVAIPAAFNAAMPAYGGWMVAISIALFAYTVLIGWAFYGEQFFEYLFGPKIIKPFRWLYCALIPVGAVIKVQSAWDWGDICNGLQVFPNVIGLLALSGIAAGYARAHLNSGNSEPPVVS